MTLLKEICRFQSGGTPAKNESDYYHGTIPWITTVSLNGSTISSDDAVEWITEKAIRESAAKIVPANSIMVGTRVGVGKVAINDVDMSTNQDIISLVDIDNNWDKAFICDYIQSQSGRLKEQARGATIKGIKVDALAALSIPDYSLDKQLSISKQLSMLRKIISSRRNELAGLDELVKARFVEMFGDPRNSENYRYVPFEEIVAYMGDIGSNGANKVVVEHLDMKDEEDYALMVRFLNFTKNDFSEDVKYISKESYDFFKKSQLHGGELIICKIGSAGMNYVMPYLKRPVSLGLNQIMVRINEKALMPYLYQYLHTDYGEYLISGCINGAVTKSITKTELKNIPVMLPPIDEQKAFAGFVEQIDKSKVEVQKALEKAQLLFDCLIQKYFG